MEIENVRPPSQKTTGYIADPSRKHHMLRVRLFLVVILFAYYPVAHEATAWSLDLDIPEETAEWQKVQGLWETRFQHQDMGSLLDTLHQLETTGSNPLDVYLWLSKSYYLQARYQKPERNRNFRLSEKYAVKALSIEPDNIIARKLLITSVASYADLPYIEKQYGQLLSQALPIKEERALPILSGVDAFLKALPDWDQRQNIEKGKRAVKAFNNIATDHPDDALAQVWASRGNYYLGYYFIAMDEQKASEAYFEKGRDYGEAALKLAPDDVFAHYWFQLNLSRTIEHANIFTKANYLGDITSHLVFTANENMTYFFNSPTSAIATILEKGGWLAEKGLGQAGYSMDMVRTAAELSVRAFPYYFYTHFAKAKILQRDGREAQAKQILESILEMDPAISTYHRAENILVQKLAKNSLKL